jgi:hypothetical protein
MISDDKYLDLERQLAIAHAEIEELREENASLWFMLDEIKKADEAIMIEIMSMTMGDMIPKIEA